MLARWWEHNKWDFKGGSSIGGHWGSHEGDSAVIGLKSGDTEGIQNSAKQHKWGKKLTLQDIAHQTMMMRLIKHKKWNIPNTVEHVLCWDSALHMAKSVESVEGPTISKWCASQYLGSRWTVGVTGQSMRLGKMTSHS